MKVYATTWSLAQIRGSDLKLRKTLEPVAGLQEMGRAEKLAELHCKHTIEDTQAEGNLQFKSPVVFHRCAERRRG